MYLHKNIFSRTDFVSEHLLMFDLIKEDWTLHVCSAFNMLQYVVLDTVHGEKLATSRYICKRKHFVDLPAL